MKNVLLTLGVVVGLTLSGCQSEKKIDLSSEEDKTLYAAGANIGQRLAQFDLTDKEVAALTQGFKDAAKGKKSQVELKEYFQKVQVLFKSRYQKIVEKIQTEGKDYLAKFVGSEGGTKTKSGLAFKVTKPGTGKFAKPTDTVKVHYHGTLISGSVFDSSKDRGKPTTFPLNRVIKGWTEGLQKVKVGGSIRLVIPSELAYGKAGAPPKIPGGATLIFDVDLIEIVKNQPKKK